MDNLARFVKQKFHRSIIDFVEKNIGLKYRMFSYRRANKTLYHNDIVKFLKALDISFEHFDALCDNREFITPPEPILKEPEKPKTTRNPILDNSKKPKQKTTGAPSIKLPKMEPPVLGHVKKAGKLSSILKDIRNDK